MNWTSKFFDDFTYLEDPRATPDYDEEVRAFIAARHPDGRKVFKWPAMRLEREILRKWQEWDMFDLTFTRIEHHMIRYLCHLVSSLEADPWFQEKVWSFYDTRRKKRKITNWFGSQNCLAPETMVRLINGGLLRADEVMEGDLLMGPDSTPRQVLTTCRGRAPMFRITPKIGQPFDCTENHLVTVIRKRGRNPARGRKGYMTGEILDIPASELATYPAWKMDDFGLISAVTEYPCALLPVDPYIYGLWLGDGDTAAPNLTNMDPEVAKEWTEYWESKGARVCEMEGVQGKNKAKRYRVNYPHRWHDNPALKFIRTSVSGGKFIRPDYLISSIEQRLELLAGLVDTDGHMAGTFYEIASSCPALAEGIKTLAESLGFRVSLTWRQLKIGRPSARINICGDIWRIPVRIPRKRKTPPQKGRGVRKHGVSGFTVTPIGTKPFSGFTVDGDHRFLLEDYTITHNSGKTTGMAALAVGLGVLHPEYTRQTASGPFKDAGESPLWNAIEETFEEVRSEWGDKLAEWTGAIWDEKAKVWRSDNAKTCCLMKATTSKGSLRFSEAPKAGTLKLVAMDEVGKVQGAKAKDRRQEDGYFVIYLDEIGAGYPTMNILRALHNLRSNRNFHMFTACNPFNPVGQLDGELGRPTGGYESLKIDESYWWMSGEGSVTYRFDGLQSPNIVLHTNKWPWLFNDERHDQLLSGTARDSDFYNSQCRAFMNIGAGNHYVLTVPDIKAGLVDQLFEWTHEQKWRVAFLDPALSTDGDAAVLTIVEGGNQRLPSGDTSPLVYAAKQITIPIFTGMIADAAWVAKTRQVRGAGKDDNPSPGDLISVERQLSVNAGWHLALEDVPRQNFAYDDSMRSKVMEAMIWALGDLPKAVSSVGDPEDTPMYPPKWEVDPHSNKRTLVTWRMDCQKFVSQVWFFGAAVVRSGLFRCHPSTMVALNQATQRFWNYAAGGKKRVVESKKDMKERARGASPDEADSMFGAIYYAHKRGLMKLKISMPDATEHFSLRSKKPPTSFIQRQWKNRKQTTGLRATGSRA